jgi:hypothetical protein
MQTANIHFSLLSANKNVNSLVSWVQCDKCDRWFHVPCVGLTKKKVAKMDSYECQRCCDARPVEKADGNVRVIQSLTSSSQSNSSAPQPPSSSLLRVKMEPQELVEDSSCPPHLESFLDDVRAHNYIILML